MDLKADIKLPKLDAKKRNQQLPTKRTINFMTVGVKKMSRTTFAACVILIILAAALFSKVLVIDRFAKLYAKEAEVAAKQGLIDEMDEQIDSYGAITGEYNRYTYSDMTADEIHLVDARDVRDLLERDVMPYCFIKAWTLSNNCVTVPVTGVTMDQANAIIQIIQKEDMVSYATLTTATTRDAAESGTGYSVQASDKGQYAVINIVIYFNDVDPAIYGLSEEDFTVAEESTTTDEEAEE